MSREKQIEEMAKALTAHEKKLCDRLPKDKCLLTSATHAQVSCDYCKIAEFLYNAGYRKQVEGEWIAKDNFNGRCTIATCSKCGVEKAFPVLVRIETISTLYPYCQKCGANMKGGAE